MLKAPILACRRRLWSRKQAPSREGIYRLCALCAHSYAFLCSLARAFDGYTITLAAAMDRRFLYSLALLLPAVARAQGTTDHDAPLWSWYGRCPQSVRMAVELRVDGHLPQRAVVPLCHLRRSAIEQRQYDARLVFRFGGGRTFRDELTTRRADTIEGNIWQASADQDEVTLGVSFMTKRQVLLNTLYVLVPGRRVTTILERGITVTSYPALASQPSDDAPQRQPLFGEAAASGAPPPTEPSIR
jgi:hypothetical protein